jgi:hypothetical protein
MLKSPLITYGGFKAYLASAYAYTKEVGPFLRRHTTIRKVTLDHRLPHVPTVLYHDKKKNPGKVTAWDVALSIHRDSYLTGYTILSLLGWTEYTPKKIYVNWIRHVTPKKAPQTVIDDETLQRVAFSPKKTPTTSLSFNRREIVVLSGQYFSTAEKKHLIRCPPELDLPEYAMTFRDERLFIEALVNYHYFGGADIVWQALLSKAEEMDQGLLLRTYSEMNLKYPYANAIGYIFDFHVRGFSKAIKWLDRVNKNLKFHLFMGDQERRIYVDKWSLYVPKRFYGPYMKKE